MGNRRARFWLAICVLVSLLVGGCGKAPEPPAPPSGTDGQDRCPLDGSVLWRKTDVSRRTLAVIIDNDPAAWPVSGLSRACLIYEVPVEGGMTRFIAFYHHLDAALAGPVRSARSYFLPLVQENDAILAHVGGSEAAQSGIASADIDALDELARADPFWQGTNRKRPYATFTNTDRMRQAAVKAGLRGAGTEKPVAIFSDEKRFTLNAPSRPECAPALKVSFGDGPQAVNYRFEGTGGGDYYRYVGDTRQRDGANGDFITPRTIVVLFLPVRMADAASERSLTLAGQGKALYYCEGFGTAGTWRKSASAARTELLDGAGQPIVLQPGPVWVHVVYEDSPVVPDITGR